MGNDGNATWKAERDAIAARNDASRKAAKAERQAREQEYLAEQRKGELKERLELSQRDPVRRRAT